MEHLVWLKTLLGRVASETVAWFAWPWGLFPWLAVGGAVALGSARRVGLLTFYVWLFFYLWGFRLLIGELGIRDYASWIHFALYFALGVGSTFAIYHWIYVRRQQASAWRRDVDSEYLDIGERGAVSLAARRRRRRRSGREG